MTKKIEVVAAIIQNGNRLLCVQRGRNKYSYISGKYEFPGGKVEAGETKEQALCREIREELTMEIHNIKEFKIVEHQYPDFSIRLEAFTCSAKSTSLTLSEHIAYKWLMVGQLDKLDWAEADIPIVVEIVNKQHQ